jgi:hypothetical protein
MQPGQRWKVCYYTPAEPPTRIVTLQISAPDPESALAAGNQYIREHHQANPAHLAATIEPDKETPRNNHE